MNGPGQFKLQLLGQPEVFFTESKHMPSPWNIL
jgi:hypothetical protein